MFLTVFVFANNFGVMRLREKIYGKPQDEEKENSQPEAES
jgi:hypothetical protein